MKLVWPLHQLEDLLPWLWWPTKRETDWTGRSPIFLAQFGTSIPNIPQVHSHSIYNQLYLITIYNLYIYNGCNGLIPMIFFWSSPYIRMPIIPQPLCMNPSNCIVASRGSCACSKGSGPVAQPNCRAWISAAHSICIPPSWKSDVALEYTGNWYPLVN